VLASILSTYSWNALSCTCLQEKWKMVKSWKMVKTIYKKERKKVRKKRKKERKKERK
jgi:hypothetical protein